VTTTQITDKMNELLGTDIDRRKVGNEPLRQLGSHQVVVRLSGDFQPELTVIVESEETEATTEVAASEPMIEEVEAKPEAAAAESEEAAG
jgi:hypothetical protein